MASPPAHGIAARRLREIQRGLGSAAASAVDENAAPALSVSTGYLMSRLKIIRAINEAPSSPNPGEFDQDICLVPCLEILGIHIAHTAVSRMVLRKQLSREAGTFLNGVLAVHAYCITHATAHGGLSQGNSDYKEMENTVFRLASVVIGMEDSHQVSHKKHHAFTNGPEDPDLHLAMTSLPELGMGMMNGFNNEFNGGSDGDFMGALQNLIKTCSIDAFRRVPELAAFHDDLWSTTQVAGHMGQTMIAMFFGRFPHRNGKDGSGETDTIFENTYRGQGQVDLWMMVCTIMPVPRPDSIL